jgi:hypothetical protein
MPGPVVSSVGWGFFLATANGIFPTGGDPLPARSAVGSGFRTASCGRIAAALVYPFKDADHRTKKNPAGCLSFCGRGFPSGGRLPCRIGGVGAHAPNRSLPREHKTTVVPGYGMGRGVRPKAAPTVFELVKREGTSTVARNVSATTGPTPGVVISLRQAQDAVRLSRAKIVCRNRG